ncbi:Protein transport protein-like protein [Hapsidospora chrysogenum ATCC 11550]|uniref:Protein transport protein SEC31 n=1 Tax=Hapsidospora chrysogenum (strain ATCC 11550 / CBS 779.69 / DSM 880 / IAM 14645 / JCM 23072 / IMI 49137) TaxID=857340 RepID=A0A086TH24_HAPC1|nr:Protein transport protein-like protein [Hapsidospora chrysogenum ATCC 11550]
MVRLRELPRTAAFAWSPGSGKPLLVTGTRAGAVDADFSDESKLELWDLALDDQQQGLELQPIASIHTESKFYDIAWGPADSDHPQGIIAGALENGSLDIWDAEKLLSGASDALISQTTKHTGPIKTLEFNPLKPQILATGGAKGELFIYDVNDIGSPFRLGNTAARADDINCLAWNRKVSHILATGGSGGFVTVWDLKTKKASLTLNNNRKAVSSIAWDPNNSTKLLTATPDDNTPVIFLWDLRNSNAPERTLQGHEQGVLSLSWCSQDSELLLSCGKDNRTIAWNPRTGERLGEFPEVTNWTFQTTFNPHNPNLSATASFDGKITVQTLQNTNPETSQTAADKNLDDEDFFSAAQTQPQGASWSLAKAPKWFERPIGASFGFGGKVVLFKANPLQPGQKRSSKILIESFSVDSSVSSATEKFQNAMASGDLTAICEEKFKEAKTDEEKADWQVMETLVGDNPRGKIVEYLGFKEDELPNGEATTEDEAKAEEETKDDGAETKTGTETEEEEKKKRLSNFFEGAEGEGEEDFLSNLAATKGAKTDNPFHLFSDGDTSVEKDVTQALMLGNFSKATDICLKEDRMADAFLIANCGGQELVDKVQSAYLSRKSGMPSYMRLLGSVIAKNLWDVVYNADLSGWKETMAILCTFSDPAEFPDLCEALGDRINENGSRKDATFCYLVGSKLEKVVSIWAAELEEAKQAGINQASEDSTFSVHARSLQNFIEKVTVFREVSKFTDNEKGLTSGWKLAALYDKYTEYADILASHGQLDAAQRYLDLLPSSYPAADIARNRVRLATQKTAPQATARQPASAARTSSRAQPVMGYQPAQPAAPAPSMNPYGGIAHHPAPSPQPQAYAPQNPYAPQGGYQPPGQPGYGNPVAPPPMGGPPRSGTPSAPPPPRAKNTDNWNDVPMVTKAPPPRRSTPSMAPITSPFPGAQQGPTAPPPPGPYGPRTVASPPPPPPKGPAPPRAQTPLAGSPQSIQGPPRPSSSAASQYAPPPPPVGPAATQPVPSIPPSVSPYNAPPAGPPPSNRYAPAPSAQQASPQLPAASMPPPPGPASRPPPSNPYGPPPQRSTPSNQYAPSPYAPPAPQQPGSHPAQGPPTGPPPGVRPGPTPPPPKASAPPKARHPAGDRSHIPPNAQQMVEIFDHDMQRVSAKAPDAFTAQVKDTRKRLNLLFDHLNNGELVQPATIEQLNELAQALQSKDYATAQRLQVEIQRDKTDECGNWMVGVKRLISMSKATP